MISEVEKMDFDLLGFVGREIKVLRIDIKGELSLNSDLLFIAL